MALELVGLVEVLGEYWGVLLTSVLVGCGGLLWRWIESRIAHPTFDQIWSQHISIPLPQSPFNRSSTPEDSTVSKNRGGHIRSLPEGFDSQDLTPHLKKSDDTDVCDKCGSTNIKTNRTPVRSADYRAIHVHTCRNCGNSWQEEV